MFKLIYTINELRDIYMYLCFSNVFIVNIFFPISPRFARFIVLDFTE